MELRLVDPNGYTVPTGIRRDVTSAQRAAVERILRTQVATTDMLANGFTPDGRRRPEYLLSAYRVQADETAPPAAAAVPAPASRELHQAA
jgi:hypothetical protein